MPLIGAAISILFPLRSEEERELVRHFNVPEGKAARTLKQAALQGGVDIVFGASIVKDVRTRSIRGDYTLARAFNLMLMDSSLAVVKHQKSGVYLVKKVDRQDSKRTDAESVIEDRQN